eukprot:scaffold80692_cov57-Phaeocystis_antarctica.AAC.1
MLCAPGMCPAANSPGERTSSSGTPASCSRRKAWVRVRVRVRVTAGMPRDPQARRRRWAPGPSRCSHGKQWSKHHALRLHFTYYGAHCTNYGYTDYGALTRAARLWLYFLLWLTYYG